MNEEISWVAPEYYHHPKTPIWFWITLLATIGLVTFALFQRNFLFAFFLVIAESLMIHWARRIPPIMEFSLSDRGIKLDKKKFYAYTSVAGFAILKPGVDPKFEELVVRIKTTVNPFVKIMIPTEDRPKIESYIRKYVREMNYEESFIERIEKILNF